MSHSILLDIQEACALPGCPVCRLARQAVKGYLSGLFYENVNDIQVREILRESRGFCREHTAQALEPGVGDPLGVSIIYHDILGNVLKEMPETPALPKRESGFSMGSLISRSAAQRVKAVVRAIAPRRACPACDRRDETTRLILSALVEALGQEAHQDTLLEALAASNGLCLPHLRQTCERISHVPLLDALVAIHKEKLEALRLELAEFIRKNDYRFREESFGSERDAWKRAIAAAAGEL